MPSGFALLPIVSGATVTTTHNVVLNTKYGRLTLSNDQTTNWYEVLANATIFFDVTAKTGTQQGAYVFTAQSYGNGTFQLRFLGPVPQSVTQSAASLSYVGWEQIQYTTSQTSTLIVVYAPILTFGVVNGSIFFSLIILASGIMYTSMFFGLTMRFFNRKGPLFLVDPRTIIISGIVGTAGFLFILVVGANLIHPACPVGYTCVG